MVKHASFAYFVLVSTLFMAQQGCQDDVQGNGPVTRDGQTRALDVDAGQPNGQFSDALITIGSMRRDGGTRDAAARGTDACELGARRCGANSDIERCEDTDGDGVSEWRSAMPAPGSTMPGRAAKCPAGSCDDDCTGAQLNAKVTSFRIA